MPVTADVRAETACHDPGRALLYEHVLSYFLDVASLGPVLPAECRQCGRQVGCVKVKAGVGTCLAQAAITSKRPTKLAEGVEAAFGAPTVPGKNAFNNERVVIVASAGASVVTTNIAPVRPLPDSLRAVRPSDLSPYDARKDLILDPPPVPFVAVVFAGRAAGFPIRPSTFREIVVINGGDEPVEVDRRAFRASLETARRIGGIDAFENALELQAAAGSGDPEVWWKEAGKSRRVPFGKAVDAMNASGVPGWVQAFAALPNRNDPETTYLRAILRREADDAARAAPAPA